MNFGFSSAATNPQVAPSIPSKRGQDIPIASFDLDNVLNSAARLKQGNQLKSLSIKARSCEIIRLSTYRPHSQVPPSPAILHPHAASALLSLSTVNFHLHGFLPCLFRKQNRHLCGSSCPLCRSSRRPWRLPTDSPFPWPARNHVYVRRKECE